MNRTNSFKAIAVALAAVAFVFSLVTAYVSSNSNGIKPVVSFYPATLIKYFDYFVEGYTNIAYVVYDIAGFLVSLISALLLAIICLAQKRNSPAVFLAPLIVTAAWQVVSFAWFVANGYSLDGAVVKKSAVVAVALLAFACCLAAKGNAGTAAIAVASILSVAAIVMMLSCTMPFGYHYDASYSSYDFDDYYIDTLIGSAALWFGVAFGMMSVTPQQTTRISQANTAASSAQVAATTVASRSFASAADELKGYKELLDMGAITQEEFDDKKKQLLGL